MPSVVITNPACGNLSGILTTTLYVLPALNRDGMTPDASYATTHPGHAGTLLIDFLDSLPTDSTEDVHVVLVSGDGTLHEIVNALYKTQYERSLKSSAPWPRQKINFVLVPAGTANALYNSFFPPESSSSDSNNGLPADRPPPVLSSLRSYGQKGSPSVLKPLTLAQTVIYPQPADTCPLPTAPQHPQTVISAIVTSTALHASILADSEALRATMPGIERFKVAAQKNASRWYNARVRLYPMPVMSGATHQQMRGGLIMSYDASRNTFIPLSADVYELEGPFSYFLTTVNVDRLEPAFRVAPLARSHPPPATVPCIDVVIVRPLRDPVIKSMMENDTTNGEGPRRAFVEKLWKVMGGAYADGKHLDFRYASMSDGEGPVSEQGTGPYVVEYFRVSKWEWIPDERDAKARTLCADGTIFDIPYGGRACCTALPAGSLDIAVHA